MADLTDTAVSSLLPLRQNVTGEDIWRQEAPRLVESAQAQVQCENARPESWGTRAASLAGLHRPEEACRPGLLRPRQWGEWVVSQCLASNPNLSLSGC